MKKIVIMALALCLGMSVLAQAKSKKVAEEGSNLSTGMAGRIGMGLQAPQDLTSGSQLPILTGRYWLSDRLGIDAAMGFSTQTTSPASGSSTNKTDFALSGGARFVLAAPVQELLITANGGLGIATSSNGTSDNGTSSFSFGLGVGIGFEAFVPAWKSLSLEGGMGLGLKTTSTTTKVAGVSSTSNDFKLATEGTGSTPIYVGIKYYFN